MFVGTGSLQHTPSAEKLCIRKLSSACNFKVCPCRFIGVGSDPSARFAHTAPSLPRAEFPANRRLSQSSPPPQKLQGERSFHEATSLQEALQPDALRCWARPSQDVERLKGFLHQHADAQPERDAQQSLPKAETLQDYPLRSQRDARLSTASSGSPQPGSINRNRDARPSKRRGSRIPARGFDVLDKLMASQGRSSRALLDSLQSTIAPDDDGMPQTHFHDRDIQASTSFRGKISRHEIVEGMRGSTSATPSNFRKIDKWKSTFDITTDEGATSSTFASSIEKALSPSTPTRTSSPTRFTLASAANDRVLEQSTSMSSSRLHAAKVSDVAKPSLQGQEVLLALQKAAIEKAKLKQRTRKLSDRASKSKEVAVVRDSEEWRDAKPIVMKPEWALQIEDLVRRIENIKNPTPLS